jgi:hypothetical protein
MDRVIAALAWPSRWLMVAISTPASTRRLPYGRMAQPTFAVAAAGYFQRRMPSLDVCRLKSLHDLRAKVGRDLVVFFWGDPPDNLKQKPLIASYFPDKSDDAAKIKSLSVRDGRVYADDQPLPNLNQPDPDFLGDKWINSSGSVLTEVR